MKVSICSVAIGGWYPRGVARMIQEFERVSPGFEIRAWVNAVPPCAQRSVVENGYDYTAYCAKPFALMDALQAGADIAILLDAAFYPIRRIHPLVEWIAQTGYYFCRNGGNVGEWSSDRALNSMGMTREEAFTVEEITSYCVGLNFHYGQSIELLQRWCGYAADRITIPGPHGGNRNPGFVSNDSRVKGHRHDQTALSVIAHRMGMRNLVDRPIFTSYRGHESEKTVLVNWGGL